MNVALVTNIPSPYRIPVWNSLAKHVDNLSVFISAKRDPDRIWEVKLSDKLYEYVVLHGKNWFVSKFDWGIYWNPSLWKKLDEVKPTHILVTGYTSPTYLSAIYYARKRNLPLTIWWGSHAMSSRFSRGPLAWFRRKVLLSADSYITYGSLATRFLQQLGISIDRIVTGINTVDVEKYRTLVNSIIKSENYKSDAPVRFIYVGQFIKRKGVLQLLDAFQEIPKECGQLDLVGYGPLENELRNFASSKLLNNVNFVGATSSVEETARLYAIADVLVLPSLTEVWGLVVNEALASGLCVVASKYAGVTHDLVENAPIMVGYSFDPADRVDFVSALKRMIQTIPQTNRDEIQSWGVKQSPGLYSSAIYNALLIASNHHN